MAKSILYDIDARHALEQGINLLAKAVAVTLGPRGRNIVLGSEFGVPQIINDGITIAKGIELESHLANTGVSLLRQVAAKTNDVAGDGTTTAIVLSHAMVKEGLRNVTAGANPISIRRGIDKATHFMLGQIAEHALPVQNSTAITQVATIAAGNDETVGQMIAEAMAKVGQKGVITLKEGKSMHTEIEITEGMQFDKGYISPHFVTDAERMEVILEDIYILLADKKITLAQELLPILEKVSQTGKPFLIIAEDIEKAALATLVLNRLRGVINVSAVKSPGFGDRRNDLLADMAVLTGGQVISEDVGLTLENTTLEMLGQARRVTITKDNTTLVAEGNEGSIEARCEQIHRQIEETEATFEKEKLQERLAKLTGGVAVLKVGAATETEMKDRKLKLEDAINATKAAVEEGIVPGGGTTLAHLVPQLEEWSAEHLVGDELIGAMIVTRSLSAPLRQIVENAGRNGSVIAERIKDLAFNTGYDAIAGEFVDMFAAGIVDPAKVTRAALRNAASIAGMVLTTECIIAEQPEPKTKDLAHTGGEDGSFGM
ncbi:chaperonin GroEL (plasmid) [Acaryochloris sp. 'Moss Beach']|uniref:chaperonin GroEL n=2 Tax=Acaryochloris TaxID=155977 RepID=UPI001EEAEA8B|nr:chaperonin GroEL [Acaryochloris sp. 'Moss Beach']UJB72662.1 chaperonin GroEL [Acaryochloris sp. 'Moss Beach']